MGFNHMRQKFGLHLEIHYECEEICGPDLDSPGSCLNSHAIYPSVIALWKTFVYPKDPLSRRHARDHMFRTCDNCGVDNLTLCLDEEKGTSSAIKSWKQFSMEKIVNKKGEEKKKLKMMHMEINSRKLIQYFKPKL